MEYEKPWLSLPEQVDRLASRGVDVGSGEQAVSILTAIGYYRLSGYLYPFRHSEHFTDAEGQPRIRILQNYETGTALSDAVALIDFDRRLRLLVMDGIERIEVAVRMQVG